MHSATVTAEELHAALAAFRAGAVHGTLDTGQYRMRYFTWGTGPPIAFIHGMADDAAAFAMVMHRLVNRFTCIGYELPDGTTDGSRLARYSQTGYTDDLLALFDRLKLGRGAVVGSSFGSIIALAALAAKPDRFSHGVLQNGFAHRPLNPFQRALARTARFWPGWFADWPEIHGFAMRRIERRILASLPPEVAAYFLRLGARTPIATSARRALAIDRADLRPLLPAIRAPVLLITGNADRLVPRACWDELKRGIPQLQRVEIAGCGHYPQYTNPKQMAEAIARFREG